MKLSDITGDRSFGGWPAGLALALGCLSVVSSGCPGRRQAERPGTSAEEPLGVEQTVRDARAALETGRSADAERLAQEALAARPDSVAAQEVLGLALYSEGKLEEAAEPLWGVVQARMAGYETCMAAVEALDAAARYGDAVSAARSAVSESPDSADANLALGLLLLGGEQYKDASDALIAAAEMEPSAPGIRLSAAEALLGAGNYDRAAAVVDEAMEGVDDENGKGGEATRAMLLLARIHTERAANPPPPVALPPPDEDGDADGRSAKPFANRVSDAPTEPVPAQDDEALAQSYIAEFERLTDDEALAQGETGVMLLRAHRPEKALHYLADLPNGAPPEAHTAYAEVLLTLGRSFDTALAEAQAGAADGDDAYPQAILGWSQWKNGDGESAVDTLSSAAPRLRAPSARGRAYYQLGRALEGLERTDEASAALAKAKELGYR